MNKTKYVTISLVDANTSELIFQTKTVPVDTSQTLNLKINKNISAFVRYTSTSDRDLVLQISLREQRQPLNLEFNPDVY